MYDIVALGEMLVDFTPCGLSPNGGKLFEQNAGGAVANVCGGLGKLNIDCAFLGMVGKDQFGYFLEDTLKKCNVDTSGLKFSQEVNTTLAFVHLFENGERDFSFYRKPGADIMYSEDDLDLSYLDNTRVFHFGSLSLTNEPVRGTTIKALKYAKKKGITISYDPNFRPPLWENEQLAKEWMLFGLDFADILKISDIEVEFLYGETDYEKAAKMLLDKGKKLVLVTLGAKGAVYAHATGSGFIKGFKVNALDTTGAGDCFLSAMLYKQVKHKKDFADFSKEEIEESVKFANAAAALCVTKKGGIPGMPYQKQVFDFLKKA